MPGASNPKAWDRYAYSYGNPIKYIDPSGHIPADNFPCGMGGECNHFGRSDKWHNDSSYMPSTGPQTPPDYLQHYMSTSGSKASLSADNPLLNQPEPRIKTIPVHKAFQIGPSASSFVPNYYSDYPGGPLLNCQGSPVCLVPAIVNTALRFPITGPVNPNDNFWLDFTITYDTTIGVTLSDILVETYYPDPAYLIVVDVAGSNGQINYEYYYGAELPNGFGTGVIVPSPNRAYNPNFSIVVTAEVGYFVDVGNGPFLIYPDYSIAIPPLNAFP